MDVERLAANDDIMMTNEYSLFNELHREFENVLTNGSKELIVDVDDHDSYFVASSSPGSVSSSL